MYNTKGKQPPIQKEKRKEKEEKEKRREGMKRNRVD